LFDVRLLASARGVIGEEGQAGWGRGQNLLGLGRALGVRKLCENSKGIILPARHWSGLSGLRVKFVEPRRTAQAFRKKLYEKLAILSAHPDAIKSNLI
jgi:hypothetical protein